MNPDTLMGTKVHKLDPDADHRAVVAEGARLLAGGGLVVFPTETVYGLGANATDPRALQRLREVKGRNEGKPFTLHIGSRSAVHRFVPGLRGLARRLTEKAWPGPLTIIFHVDQVEEAPIIRETSVEHAAALYHQGTIGIRCPDDRIALDLLSGAGVPVVAASANFAAQPPPVTGEEALATLDGKVDLLIDAGRTRYAKASTIVEVVGSDYRVVREGVLDERTLRRLTQVNFLVVCSGNTCRSPMGEGILRRLLAEKLGLSEIELAARGYNVESAGLAAAGGMLPSPAAVRALRARGIDISGHRSQPATLDQIQRADYIFAMTGRHLDSIMRMYPPAGDRARRVADEDIEDPIGESDEVYAQCARQIEQALRSRLEEMTL